MDKVFLPDELSGRFERNWKCRRGLATIRCGSLAEFHAIYASHFRNQRNMVFRGHADIRWRLRSSLARTLRARQSLTGLVQEELQLDGQLLFPPAFSEFLQKLHLIGDHEVRSLIKDYYSQWADAAPESLEVAFKQLIVAGTMPEQYRKRLVLRKLEIQLLAIAQHYGMPTPLLDWTKSPFVAWYFALSERSAYYPTVIGMFPSAFENISFRWLQAEAARIRTKADREVEKWNEEHPDHNLARGDMVNVYELGEYCDVASFSYSPALSHFNDRQVAQQGTFSKHSLRFSLDEIVRHLSPSRPLLYKFVLTDTNRKAAMIDLRMMDITGQTLFPGLVGAARLGADAVQFDEYSALISNEYPFGLS